MRLKIEKPNRLVDKEINRNGGSTYKNSNRNIDNYEKLHNIKPFTQEEAKFFIREKIEEKEGVLQRLMHIVETSPSGTGIIYWNREPDTIRDFDTGYTEDIENTAIIKTIPSVTKWITSLVFPVSKYIKIIASILSLSEEYISNRFKYRDWIFQKRVFGKEIAGHEWFGKYKYNLLTKEIIAVEFHKRGKTEYKPISPIYLQTRTIDAKTNKNIYEDEPVAFYNIIGVSEDSDIIPEKSFGSIE